MSRFTARFMLVATWALTIGLFFGGSFVYAQTGDGCGPIAEQASSGEAVDALEASSRTTSDSWSCQKIDLNSPQRNSCIQGGCPNQPGDVLCCVAGTGARPASPTPPPAPTPSGGNGSSWWVPANLQSCMDTGNCQLEDVVSVGAAFANFLFGISGAIALVILVYGGFRYLWAGTPAGGAEDVKAAKTAMTAAAIGLTIIFLAHALVRFVYTSLVTPSNQPPAASQPPTGP